MSNLYNKTFKIGFISTIAVFAVMNVFSYTSALQKYELLKNQPIKFAPAPRIPTWGVPFKWDGYNFPYDPDGSAIDLFGVADGLVLNFLGITICAFLVGIAVRRLTKNYE